MSDYDRPSALQDPVALPPGRGRAAKSARVSAPGSSAAAVEEVAVHMFTLACGAPRAISRRMFRGEGIDKEDREMFLSHAREALTAALPILRAEIEAEVREEYEGKIEVAEARRGICHNMLRYIAFVLTGDETADVQLAADRAKTEIDRLVALLPTTTPEGTDEAT